MHLPLTISTLKKKRHNSAIALIVNGYSLWIDRFSQLPVPLRHLGFSNDTLMNAFVWGFVYMSVRVHACLGAECVQCPWKPEEGGESPHWSYRWLWVAPRGLGVKPRPSARTAGALTRWAISPVLTGNLGKCLFLSFSEGPLNGIRMSGLTIKGSGARALSTMSLFQRYSLCVGEKTTDDGILYLTLVS